MSSTYRYDNDTYQDEDPAQESARVGSRATGFLSPVRHRAGDDWYLTPIKSADGIPMTTVVHQRLRDAILNLELAPGERISQLELSRQLSVSRTPLREALRLLEREALIEPATPHGLVVIKPLSAEDLQDIYSLRLVGEALAVWLTVPELDKGALKLMADDLRIIDEAEPQTVRQAHRRFHDRLRAGSTWRLRLELRKLFEHSERYQLAALSAGKKKHGAVRAEHRGIVKAARAGNRLEAAELVVDHLAGTAYQVLASEAPEEPTTVLDAAVTMARSGLRDLAKGEGQPV